MNAVDAASVPESSPNVTLTFFGKGEKAKGFRNATTWERLYTLIANVGPAKTVNKLDLPGWCAATFMGNYRQLANVEHVVAVVLDFDNMSRSKAGQKAEPLPDSLRTTPEAAMKVWNGTKSFFYTSWSHTKEVPKFRLVLPLSRPVSATEFAVLWRYVADQHERVGHVVDPQCKDASHLWFFGARRNEHYSTGMQDGPALDVDSILVAATMADDVTMNDGPSSIGPVEINGDIRERASRFLAKMPEAIDGSEGHKATLRAAIALVRGFGLSQTDALDMLVREYNPRCRPPWTERELRHKVQDAATKIHLAKGDPRIRIHAHEVDAHPFLLNVQNGIVDLRAIDPTTGTCKLIEHDPKFLLTRITKVAYVPTATCPTWRSFCTFSANGDAEVEAYRRRRRGSYLSGSPDKVFEVAFGTGDTGKTTYYQTITRVLGTYARKVPRTLFEMQRNEQHPTDLMELDGVRFVFGAEIEGSLDIKKVKDITGERTIKARGMRENWQDIERRYKIAVFANDRPPVRRTNKDPIWNRIHADKWSAVIVEKRKEAEIDEVYEREAEGILADMVRGWVEYQKIGLAPPKAVMEVTREYRNDEDPIEAWLSARCDVTDPKAQALFSDLAASRKTWLEANDPERKESGKALAALLEQRGFLGGKDTRGNAIRIGIKVRAPTSSSTSLAVDDANDAEVAAALEQAVREEHFEAEANKLMEQV